MSAPDLRARHGWILAPIFGSAGICACSASNAVESATRDAGPDANARANEFDPYSICGPNLTYPPDDEAGCGPGSVTFQLTGQPGVEWWLNDTRGTNSPAANWLTLLSCDAQSSLDLNPTEDTTSRDCSSCPMSWSLSLGALTWKLPTAGQTQTWDGTYVLPGTCGDQALTCVSPRCASAGRYIAQMCACAPSDETPQSCQNPVCVLVGFDYPAQRMVSGVLPAVTP